MKIGPHVILPSAPALAWARTAPIVKTLDKISPLEAAQPDAVRVFRHYFPDQDLAADPGRVAGEILDNLLGYRHPRLHVEVYNEVPREMTARHAALLREVTVHLHAAGVKVCGPCASTGAYEAEDWAVWRTIGLDLFNVHCYWGQQGFGPWHALRYRQYWRPGDPPLVISEAGRDRVEGGQGGWKRDGISAEQYVRELQAYDAEIAKDSYVLGATIFTAGPTEDWAAFSTDDLGLDAALAAAPYFPPDSPIVVPPVQPRAPANDQAAIVSALDGCWHWCNQADAAAEALLAANRKLRQEIVELKVALGLQPA